MSKTGADPRRINKPHSTGTKATQTSQDTYQGENANPKSTPLSKLRPICQIRCIFIAGSPGEVFCRAQSRTATRAKSPGDKWHDETVVANRVTRGETAQSPLERFPNRRAPKTAMIGSGKSDRRRPGDELAPTSQDSNCRKSPSEMCSPQRQPGMSPPRRKRERPVQKGRLMPNSL